MAKSKLKIIPIGGLGEIGKNMMVMEYEDDIIVIDAGLMFPEEEMLGVDLVIPRYLLFAGEKEKIRGIIVTHGHEDHIGAMAYVLPQLNVPVYSTKLTNGLISVKLKEHKALADADLRIVPPGGKITLGKFRVEFFPVCHSIRMRWVLLSIHRSGRLFTPAILSLIIPRSAANQPTCPDWRRSAVREFYSCYRIPLMQSCPVTHHRKESWENH